VFGGKRGGVDLVRTGNHLQLYVCIMSVSLGIIELAVEVDRPLQTAIILYDRSDNTGVESASRHRKKD
jgi:hypothetical protein